MNKRSLLAVVVLLIAIVLTARHFLAPRHDALPDLSGVLEAHSLEHAGLTRSYQVYRPADLPAGAPLLFVFHGSMSTGNSMRELSARQFDRLADEQGLMVVYPDGVEKHWNDCRASASYAANQRQIDDVGFVVKMIAERVNADAVDTDRVYATGLSNGGHMVLRLALEAPALMAGYAPIVANLPVRENMDCTPSGQAVNIALIEGTEDPVNPYDGGVVKLLWDDSRGAVNSALESVAYFAALAGYDGEPRYFELPDRDTSDDGSISARLWFGGDWRVGLFTMDGGGHILPSVNSHFGILGGDIRDVDTADLLWAFFTADPDSPGLP